MEHTSNEQSGLNDQGIQFNIDQFDLKEEFSFKPMTKGLGFHHEKKVKTPVNRTAEKMAAPQQRIDSRNALKTPRPEIDFNRKDLSMIYGQTEQAKPNTATKKVSRKYQEKDAPILKSFAAFLLDLTLVLAITTSIAFIFSLAAGISVEALAFYLLRDGVMAFAGFSSLIFLFYFSIFDFGQTIGKYLLGIKLKSTTGRRLKLDQTFIRALVCLLSALTLFLPLFINFHGRISDTKVVNAK